MSTSQQVFLAIYAAVGLLFVLAVLRDEDGRRAPLSRLQTIAVVAAGLLWPVTFSVALGIGVHIALRDEMAKRKP